MAPTVNGERPPTDVLGLPPQAALQRLHEAGVPQVRVTETTPPRGAIAGEQRVVRVNAAGQTAELVVAAFPQLQGQPR